MYIYIRIHCGRNPLAQIPGTTSEPGTAWSSIEAITEIAHAHALGHFIHWPHDFALPHAVHRIVHLACISKALF